MNARTREEWEELKLQREATTVAYNIQHEEALEIRRSIPSVEEIMDGADLTGYVNYDFPGEVLLLSEPAKMLMLHRISHLLESMIHSSPKNERGYPIQDADKSDRLLAFLLKSFTPPELAIWMKDVSLRSSVSFVTIPKTETRRKFFKAVAPYVRAFIR